MIISLILLIIGVVFLVKGSGIFVGSASHIAKKLGVSDFIIGLTLVALGTSLPELTSSIIASIEGASGLVLGTIIGANIANLTLIIGIAAFMSKIKVEKEILKRDGYVLLLVTAMLLLFLYDSTISRIEGVIFLLLYISYTFFLIESKSKIKESYNFSDFARYFVRFGYLSYIKKGLFLRVPNSDNKKNNSNGLWKHYSLLALGLVVVILSAELVVKKAVELAKYFHVVPLVIGALISFGTTLPELSVAITSSKKKHGNVAIGNSIGSCITNILLIVGISAIILPVKVAEGTLSLVVPFLVLSTLLSMFFALTKNVISKKEGVVLISIYVLFLLNIVFGS